MAGRPRYHLAYVFERFPTFTQTFCVREVAELRRLGLRPIVFSIRDTRDEPLEDHFPPELIDTVHFLPPTEDLKRLAKRWKDAGELPQEAVLTLRHWGGAADKNRVYEAIYIGMKMREAGVFHAHSHFAGVGARCCFWTRRFFGISFSFTGHANDLFEETGFEVGLGALVGEAALVITVSDYTAGWLCERFPRWRGKVKRVYNGLDLEPFERVAESRALERDNLILSVGRLIEKKGFADLLRACALLKAQGETSFRCVIIGDGPLEDDLAALVRQLELDEDVELAGARSQGYVVGELAAARVFALACVTEQGGGKDNLPTVLMEAMAAALPCVSTRLAGVPEMVIDGETGLLAPERSPEELAVALRELLADRGMAETMGVAGQRRARERFAKEKTARALRDRLVSHGGVRWDWNLVSATPKLALNFASGTLRIALARCRPKQPSRFREAEKLARAERDRVGD